MVGYLNVFEEFSYMARDIWNVNWAEMNRYFNFVKDPNYYNGAKQHLWDGYTVAHQGYTNFLNATNQNPAYFPFRGAVDSITGLPILSDYGYLIGRNSPTSYVNDANSPKPTPLHFPGRVRFARTGLASVDAGDQFVVGTKVVVSGGAIAEFQGFVIADSAA